MAATGGLIALLSGILSLATLIPLVGRAAARGSLGRDSGLGIKTNGTTSSGLAWKTGHEAALPWLVLGSRTGYGTAVLSVLTAAARELTGVGDGIEMFIGSAGGAAMVVLFMVGGRKANQAATEVLRSGE